MKKKKDLLKMERPAVTTETRQTEKIFSLISIVFIPVRQSIFKVKDTVLQVLEKHTGKKTVMRILMTTMSFYK